MAGEKKERLFHFPEKLEKLIRMKTAEEMITPNKSKDLNSRVMPQIPNGAKINAVEFKEISDCAKKLPDDKMTKKVLSVFQIAPKYQALSSLLHPKNEIRNKHLDVVVGIARAVTKQDRIKLKLLDEEGY